MTERWRTELTKLRAVELPDEVWERVGDGPRLEPVPETQRSRWVAAAVAVAVFAAAVVIAIRAFAPLGEGPAPLHGPAVTEVPPRGEVAPVFLPGGRPVFVVHHEDGTVSVVDVFSSHRTWGIEGIVVWCPSTREFVEWGHEAHFDEYGTWLRAEPAPSGLRTFGFDVVSRDADGDPASIRIGAIRDADPRGSPLFASLARPPLCPAVGDDPNVPVTHTIDESQVDDTPAGVVAAARTGWAPVRGTLMVSSDGTVRLCGRIEGERCIDGAIVRGVNGVGLMENVLQPHPGTAFAEPQVWLVKVRDGVIDDTAIVTRFHIGR
jgi:hypothetical protein